MGQTDWADLKIFLGFARGGSVRSAAVLLGLSHSTVSRRLEQLEKTAGVQLFERSGRGFRLTEAGLELQGASERIEEEVLRLERHAFGLDQTLSGTITLTTADTLAIEAFLLLMAEFAEKYPMIEVKLDTGFPLVSLDRREADLALRFGAEPDEHLIGRKLAQTARAVYASQKYLEKLDRGRDRQQAGWISFSVSGESETWKKSTPFPDLPTLLRCFDVRTHVTACRAGLGLSLLPCFMCDPEPDLVRISEPQFVARQNLWLLRHADARGNARVRVLSDFLIANIHRLFPLFNGETAETWQGAIV